MKLEEKIVFIYIYIFLERRKKNTSFKIYGDETAKQI